MSNQEKVSTNEKFIIERKEILHNKLSYDILKKETGCEIMKENIEIEKIIPNDLRTYVREKRENGMFLSDYQIDVLKRNGFHYEKYHNIKELLFDVEDYLNQESNIEDDELENIASELSEREYYSHTNQ